MVQNARLYKCNELDDQKSRTARSSCATISASAQLCTHVALMSHERSDGDLAGAGHARHEPLDVGAVDQGGRRQRALDRDSVLAGRDDSRWLFAAVGDEGLRVGRGDDGFDPSAGVEEQLGLGRTGLALALRR